MSKSIISSSVPGPEAPASETPLEFNGKELTEEFNLIDSHNTSLETIKEHALDAAKRREGWHDEHYYHDDLEVVVEGPFTKTEVYYTVKSYGKKVCMHPKEKVYSSNEGMTNEDIIFRCECGKLMAPKEFEPKNG